MIIDNAADNPSTTPMTSVYTINKHENMYHTTLNLHVILIPQALFS